MSFLDNGPQLDAKIQRKRFHKIVQNSYINSKVGFEENCQLQTRRVQEMASIISNDANNGAVGDRQQTL